MTRMLRYATLTLCFCVAWIGSAVAQDATKKAEDAAKKAEDAADKAEKAADEANEAVKKIASSGEDLSGDRLTLIATTPGFKSKRESNVEKTAAVGTKLRVIRETGGILSVVVDSVPCVFANGQASVSLLSIAKTGKTDCVGLEDIQVKAGEAYEIAKSAVEDYGYRRSGWVYGALLLPYKYHRHDKSFSSAATVGPYLGYRLDGLGFDTSFVGSIGIASLSVENSSGGTSTLQGYTMAFGIIGSVNKNKSPLQFGLMFGKDWAGSNSPVPYKHEGKSWVAVQIGFSFSE